MKIFQYMYKIRLVKWSFTTKIKTIEMREMKFEYTTGIFVIVLNYLDKGIWQKDIHKINWW